MASRLVRLKPTITLKRFEASKLDANLDRSGKHGKEGSAEDRRKDAKMVKDMNTRYGKPVSKSIKGPGMKQAKTGVHGRHNAIRSPDKLVAKSVKGPKMKERTGKTTSSTQRGGSKGVDKREMRRVASASHRGKW